MIDEAPSSYPDLPAEIVCVDCGGTCHLLTVQPREEVGELIVTYRCSDCLDRWDLVFDDPEDPDLPGSTSPSDAN